MSRPLLSSVLVVCLRSESALFFLDRLLGNFLCQKLFLLATYLLFLIELSYNVLNALFTEQLLASLFSYLLAFGWDQRSFLQLFKFRIVLRLRFAIEAHPAWIETQEVFVDLGLTALTDRKPIAVNRDSFLDTFRTILGRDVYFPLGHLAAVNHHQGIG